MGGPSPLQVPTTLPLGHVQYSTSQHLCLSSAAQLGPHQQPGTWLRPLPVSGLEEAPQNGRSPEAGHDGTSARHGQDRGGTDVWCPLKPAAARPQRNNTAGGICASGFPRAECTEAQVHSGQCLHQAERPLRAVTTPDGAPISADDSLCQAGCSHDRWWRDVCCPGLAQHAAHTQHNQATGTLILILTLTSKSQKPSRTPL